jgi:hypothetical protein
MSEDNKRRITAETPEALAEAIRQAAGDDDITRVEIGEGKDSICVADANPARLRSCGPPGNRCTFCCTAAGVNELEKPPMVACKHLAGRACGIYADRPKSCSQFACGWLLGNFDERFRPDRIGAYVAFFMTDEFGFYAVVQADSRRLNPKRLRQLVRRLITVLPEVRVVYDDERGMIFRAGQPTRRFRIRRDLQRNFEDLVYEIEEEPAGY